MKISEITVAQIKSNLGYSSNNQDDMIGIYADAAKAYIISYTGIKQDDLDNYADLAFVYLALIADMFLNRSGTAETAMNQNRTVKTIMDMHRLTYLM